MMEEINKFIYINELFALYGALLTDKQQEMMRLYYQFDFSLQEISENLNISRAAVSDTIKKAGAHLEKYEQVLGLKAKKAATSELIDKLEMSHVSDEQKQLLNQLKKEI